MGGTVGEVEQLVGLGDDVEDLGLLELVVLTGDVEPVDGTTQGDQRMAVVDLRPALGGDLGLGRRLSVVQEGLVADLF